uniref:Cytochrome P450 82an1 n=1 Tax=Reynoutria sachalinensis TaxID=76036 RepID=A0A140JTI2_9CARY|nr:cytochrome P450 82an1 [Fallopia sachalinensis]
MDFLTVLASSFLPSLIFLYYVLKLRKIVPKTKTTFSSTLKPPGAWPILGHLPLFALQKAPTFRTLAAMADLHGPVFVVQLGMQSIVVVNSWEFFKECLTIKDKQLASRPLFAQGKYLGDDFASFGLAPLGSLWREMRKLTMVELLSTTKLGELGHIRMSELNDFLKAMHQSSKSNNKIVLSEWFSLLVMNTIIRLIARKRYTYDGVENQEAKRVRKVVKELMYVFGQFVLSDAFPLSFVEWLDPQGHIQMMKRVSKEIDQIFGDWIDDHRQRGQQDEKDFVDVLISLADQGKIKCDQYDADTIIKATIKSIFVGANDSTSLTLTWMTSLLLNHRHVMRRVVEEIDQEVGRDRWVEESDIKSLVYLQAVVKETLRLYPPGPLSTPHAAAEDCCVAGHEMKKGDQLLFNVWKVHRDPRVWSQPDEFIPERFLEENKVSFGVTKGPEFWYIPFGSGRRSCPGSELAFQVLHLTMARFLQGFALSTPMDEAVDMDEGQGISLLKKAPLEVNATPRLSSNMYEKL